MNSERFWEVDFSRGIGIVMMIASNFITDLQFFENYNAHEIFWKVFAVVTASIFLLLVGISLNLSYAKSKDFKKYLKRGAFIFGLGLIITLITFFFIPHDYIRFGVLHLIGLSIILAYPFLKLDKRFSLVLGAILVFMGFLVKNIVLNSNFLLWIGFRTADFVSVDYFPLLPWFGVVLIGLFLGKWLYPDGVCRFKVPDLTKIANQQFLEWKNARHFFIRFIKPISWLGKHSLVIYFIHQPILLGMLYFL